MPRSKKFPRSTAAAIDQRKIIGVRAGARSSHRFTGVWVVVVNGRVFARSWDRRPGGWFRTLLEDPLGVIQIGSRNLRVRAIRHRSKRVSDAVERAYAQKYSTPGALSYVKGFRTPSRREATIEFIPR